MQAMMTNHQGQPLLPQDWAIIYTKHNIGCYGRVADKLFDKALLAPSVAKYTGYMMMYYDVLRKVCHLELGMANKEGREARSAAMKKMHAINASYRRYAREVERIHRRRAACDLALLNTL